MNAKGRRSLATRSRLALWVVATVAFGPSACGSADASPEQAARNFIASVRSRDAKAVIGQLDVASREQLERMAEVATDRVGGRRVIEADELLQIVSVDAAFDVDAAKVLDQSDTAARVELTAPSGEVEIISLLRQQGAWRVVLPGLGDPQGAASSTASANGAT